GRPLAVLIHGLTGCEASIYVVRAALVLLRAGYPVLRLNLRGAGPSRHTSSGFYHAGLTGDLRAFFAELSAPLRENGVVALGYSLGGNLLLKYLGEEGPAAPLIAGIAVSAPADLAATAARFHQLRNALYHRWLLARLKAEALATGGAISESERAVICDVRSCVEFDDRFVAPRHGFAGVDDYYRRSSALRYLAAVRVPTLVIHALNDPWIPAAWLDGVDWRGNGNLVPLIASGGGHVGFHGRGDRTAWHDRCTLSFLDDVLGSRRAA
ncbi:MAG: YheT family hydrolase, partial [Alphaproteobacteria bacterium]